MARVALMDELAGLSAKDLKELRARAALLLEGKETAGSDGQTLVYHQIVIMLRGMGQTQIPPLRLIKSNPKSAKALEAADVMLEYIDRYFQPERKIDRINAVQLLLKMLIRRLEVARKGISAHELVWMLPRVEEIVEEEFPGYRVGGFLRMLLAKFHLQSEMADAV